MHQIQLYKSNNLMGIIHKKDILNIKNVKTLQI